jgi:hypothetical protein
MRHSQLAEAIIVRWPSGIVDALYNIEVNQIITIVEGSHSCVELGDINSDGGWNVLDIVALANCVLAGNCPDLEYVCAADMNGDGGYNVLDIVALANCVLAGSCGG